MEELKSNAILKFNENQLIDVRKAFGYDNVNKLKLDIKQLDDWIKQQAHFRVKDFDHGYLERMLIFNKGSIERAKQRLDKLFTCTNLMPEFLQNFDIRNEFVHLFNVTNTCVLPKPLENHYRILITNLKETYDTEFNLIDFYRYCVVFGHYLYNNDYCIGYEVVADSRNITIEYVGKLHPIILHQGLKLLVEAMGLRIRKMHLLSGSKLLDTALTILKQGISAKLKERIVIHTNVESLYEHIPKEQLPKDFGGDEKSMKELNDMNFKELNADSHIARLKLMEKAGTNESLRLVCKFNEEYSGMPGSFKTFCVD